jgi:hypothetical protein
VNSAHQLLESTSCKETEGGWWMHLVFSQFSLFWGKEYLAPSFLLLFVLSVLNLNKIKS